MTVAASGSNGIILANNANINFGTGNFTLVWRGSLPDWTPSGSTSWLFYKYDAAGSWALGISTDGTIDTYINGSHYSTSSPGFTDGSVHEIVSVITVGVANTTIDYYIDGKILGTQVVFANTGTVSNTTNLSILGHDAVRTAGTCSFCTTYNCALTAAEVLDLYRNGINYADKWGSQVVVSSDTEWTGATGANPPTGWSVSQYADYTIFNSGDGTPYDVCLKLAHDGVYDSPAIYKNYSTTIGKKYRFSFCFKQGTAPNGTVKLGSSLGGNEYGIWTLTNAVWIKYEIEFIATTGTACCVLGANTATSGQYELFDEIFLYKIGATFALESEGIHTDKWYDSSTNALNATYPATGSSLVRNIYGVLSGTSGDNSVPRFVGTSGKEIETTSVIIDDNGRIGLGIAAPVSLLQAVTLADTSTAPLIVASGGGTVGGVKLGNFESSDADRTNKWTFGRENTSTGDFILVLNGSEKVRVDLAGKLGVGIVPTAVLHLKAGTASANTAPLKLTSGTNLGTPEDGVLEYDGSHLSFTIGSTRNQLDAQGTSGTSGSSGSSGTSGIDGTSGTSGVDGSSGTSGVDGTSGSSGTTPNYVEISDGTSGTSGTIDFSAGLNHSDTLGANTAFAFTAPPVGYICRLRLIQGTPGGWIPVWPGTVKWPGGVTPTLTATTGRQDLFSFYFDGTSYLGGISPNYS
jgi:hypothetical protein